MTLAFNPRPVQKHRIMTVEELKEIYLFGVDLTDDKGNEMPDRLHEFYIDAAQGWLEKELGGLSLCETRIVDETHDYYINDYVSYSAIKLYRTPVIDVESVGFQFPLQSQVLNFDPSWYRTEAVGAYVNLVPTQGTFSSILLSQAGNFMPLFYSGLQHVPAVLKVTYTSGFRKGEIPALLKHMIGLKASMGPFNIAGDLIAGAGIATKSISLDGLSQSISTTSSATNAGYGARIIQYQKEIDEAMSGLKNYYVGPAASMVIA